LYAIDILDPEQEIICSGKERRPLPSCSVENQKSTRKFITNAKHQGNHKGLQQVLIEEK